MADTFGWRLLFEGAYMAFIDKMKEYLDKGVEVSKEALTKAGDVVQDLSDKGVTKIETHQLVSRQNKEYRALGQAVCQFFEDNPSGSLSAQDSSIAGIIAEIQRLDKEIAQREESLKSGGDKADSNNFSATEGAGTEGEKDSPEMEAATDAEFTKSE